MTGETENEIIVAGKELHEIIAAAKELGIKLTNAKPGRRHMTGKHRFADAGAIGELERPKNGCA